MARKVEHVVIQVAGATENLLRDADPIEFNLFLTTNQPFSEPPMVNAPAAD
jgi:hypothetical protein